MTPSFPRDRVSGKPGVIQWSSWCYCGSPAVAPSLSLSLSLGLSLGLGRLNKRIRALEQSIADAAVVPGDDPVPMRFDEPDDLTKSEPDDLTKSLIGCVSRRSTSAAVAVGSCCPPS